jgi:O-antigen/teichoic acid export membrane protein
MAYIPFGLLQGQGRSDLSAKIQMYEAVPFLATVCALTTWLGLPGAALAWTLRMVIDAAILLRVGRCWSSYLARALPALGLLAACWMFSRNAPSSFPWIVTWAALIGSAFAVLALALDPTLRNVVLGILRGRFVEKVVLSRVRRAG